MSSQTQSIYFPRVDSLSVLFKCNSNILEEQISQRDTLYFPTSLIFPCVFEILASAHAVLYLHNVNFNDSQVQTFRYACPKTSAAAPRRWKKNTRWLPGETSKTSSRRPAPASSFSSHATLLLFKVRAVATLCV